MAYVSNLDVNLEGYFMYLHNGRGITFYETKDSIAVISDDG